jgi:hypothetical protein
MYLMWKSVRKSYDYRHGEWGSPLMQVARRFGVPIRTVREAVEAQRGTDPVGVAAATRPGRSRGRNAMTTGSSTTESIPPDLLEIVSEAVFDWAGETGEGGGRPFWDNATKLALEVLAEHARIVPLAGQAKGEVMTGRHPVHRPGT